MKNSHKFLGVTAAALVAVLMLAAWFTFRPQTTQGSKAISIEVVDHTGAAVIYQLSTDAEYLQGAMEQAEGLTFEYTDGPYGASVHTVNGVRADYTLDAAYWSFYVNGEYCTYGISEQPVADGDAFRIAYTPA